MKSALFESINDRQNIANAYLRIVNESSDEDDISHAFEGKQYPLTVYDEHYDDGVIDLYDIAQEYKSPEYYDIGSGEYYIAFAFEKLGTDGVYKKLLEEEPEYRQSQQEIIRAGCTYGKNDVISSIENIGKEIIDKIHENDIELSIPEWAVTYFENGDDSGLEEEDLQLIKNFENKIPDGYSLVYGGEDLGFRRYPEFGDACDCVRYYLIKDTNESVEKSDGWFDADGNILKRIPKPCVDDCSEGGTDVSEVCAKWVNHLGFADDLDIPMAKGYLKATGGYTEEQLSSMSPNEVAMNLLWIICGDIKEGMSPDMVYIGDYGRFGDDSVVESARSKMYRVVLTGLEWPKKAVNGLPTRDSMTVEVMDGEDMRDVIKGIYVDSYGFPPLNSFNIAKSVEIGDGRSSKKNEVNSQQELNKLKKKNPGLKDISETK